MRIDDVIGDARTVGIGGHIRPDGDCIGSCMGMYLYLRRKYPKISVDVFLEEIPEEYRLIKDTDKVRTDFATETEQYDLFIVLDSGKERLGRAEKYFDAAVRTVNIDHHISNTGTGDVNYIVPDASSASELVYRVIDTKMLDRYKFSFAGNSVLFEKNGESYTRIQLNSASNYARLHLVNLIERQRVRNGNLPLRNIILGCTHYL